MRPDEFIGTACMVSIYDRKHDFIFKRIEINLSEKFKSNFTIEWIGFIEEQPSRPWTEYILQTRSFSGL